VTMTQGLEVAGVLVSSKGTISGPLTSSPFLRNLQFDIAAVSAPDARMEWPSAELEAEANLRVRGTWEHPILLGYIHILSGEMAFHGQRYRVTSGDLNFANPFRLDPVLNVEATTTIQQYEITLNFNGPEIVPFDDTNTPATSRPCVMVTRSTTTLPESTPEEGVPVSRREPPTSQLMPSG